MRLSPWLLLSFTLVCCFFHQSYAQTWTGPSGGSWATPANWSTGSVPTAAGNVVIMTPGPTLDGAKNIASLLITGTGSINLATFQLTCSGSAFVTGGTISNGTLSAARLTAFESTICTNLVLIHSGGIASTVNGGNTFNGPTEIHLTGGESLILGNTIGDTFNGNVLFRNASTNNARTLTIANAGRTVIAGNATLSASANGGVVIGGATGTCEIQGTIETGTYAATASLTLRRVKQVSTVSNGTFSIANFVALNDTLNGAFSLTGSTSISLTTSRFLNTCAFSSPSYVLTGNTFATVAGTVSLTKTGAVGSTVAGGNTFGPGSITLTGTAWLRLANVNGDSYTSDFTFINSTTNQMLDVSYNGVNTFSGNVTLQNSSSAGILFSAGTTGRSVITGAILNGGYPTGSLTLQRVKQLSTSANGTFSVTTFTANRDTLNGAIGVTTSGTNSLTNSFFENTCTFVAPTFVLTGCRLATTSGTATITRNGAVAATNNLAGGNTFGPVTITQSGTGGGLLFAATNGDTFLGDVTLVNTTNFTLDMADRGTNAFAGNVTIDNVSTANPAIRFGNTSGTSVIAGNLLNTQFTAGSLTLRGVSQTATTANGTFNVTNFTALNANFNGDISVTAAAGQSLTNSVFARNCTFIGGQINTLQGCQLATVSGTATITKTGGTANTPAGGNTFGTAIITNAGTASLQMSSTTGDTYLGDVSFVNTSPAAALTLSFAGTTTIAGNASLQNTSSAGIIFGQSATVGRTVITGNLVNLSYTGPLTLRKVNQLAVTPNSAFTLTTFTALNDTLNGDIDVTATVSHSLTNSFFERNCTFVSTSIAVLQGCRLATTSGTAVITKTGTGNNNTNGGNTFGTAIITNSATVINSQLQMSTTTGDTYLGNVSFVNSSTGQLILLSQAGTTTIAGNLSLQNSSTAGIIIGAPTTGRTVLAGILVNGTYSGPLTMRRLKQVSTSPNDAFSMSNFTALNDTISGDISITASAGQSLTSSIFERNCTFIGAQINTLTGNKLAIIAGSAAVITKTGINDNDVAGGNTFGPITINHSGNGNRLRFANTTGDTFLGNVTLNNQTVANSLTICFAGKNTIVGDITFTGTSTMGIFIGNSASVATSGTTVLSGVLKDGGFPLGAITLTRVKQTSLAANGPFSIANFTAISDTLSGDISVTASAIHSLTNAIFERNSTFIGAQILTLQGNRFSTVSGTTTITKTGATANTPAGGNTFAGDAVISLTAAAANLQMSSTTGDTYLANVSFVNISPASNLTLSFAGTTTITGNASLQNSSTGGIIFGQSATVGRTVITGNLLNIAYTGPLTLRKVRQLATTANGVFSTTAFTALNDTLSGDISVTASGAHSLTSAIFERNCTFVGAQISELRGCSLATVSGTATVTKTGGTGNTPYGGNTFGTAVITLGATATAGLTMANTAGDTYLADATFANVCTATQSLTFSNAGRTTVAGNVNLQNSSGGGITIGPGATATGTTRIQGTIQNLGYASGPLSIRRTRQMSASANGTFAPTAFAANTDTLSGEITINATASINLNSTWFETSCTLVAPSIASMASCRFSVLSGTTILTKAGTTAADDVWAGNNRFGNVVITNATNRYIRMTNAAASPDTFMAGTTATFVRTGTGTLTPAYTSNVRFLGNISTAGSTGAITFGQPATGRVLIEGNAAQTFTGGGATTIFSRLTMNTSGTFVLNNNLNIGTNVTFTAGKVMTSAAGILIFNAGSGVTGASSASFVDGPVRKVGNTTFTYPIGDGATFGPCSITIPGGVATDHYTIEYFLDSPDPTYNTSAVIFPIDHISQVEYWNVQRTNGTSMPEATFFWGPHSGGVNDPATLVVARWNGAAWVSEGGASQTGTPTSGSISTGGGLSTFGVFAFGSISSGPTNLPVVLSNWQAEKLSTQVLLSWQTAMEENVSHFEIERSGDNVIFAGIGQMLAVGNSNLLTDYNWTDSTPLPSVSYYRLRMVDVDGQLALSDVLTVTRGEEGQATASFYPNPVQDYIHVTASVPLPRNARITLIDQQGKQLSSLIMEQTGYAFDMDTRELPSGIYHLRFDTEFDVPTVRFVIER